MPRQHSNSYDQFRSSANYSRGQRKKARRGLLHTYGAKRVGITFIALGMAIFGLSGMLIWQEVNADKNTGWAFVGTARQYEAESPVSNPTSHHIAANVYACKSLMDTSHSQGKLYSITARAVLSDYSIKGPFASPRLAVVSDDKSSIHYSASETISDQHILGEEVETTPTETLFPDSSIMYYSFNNYFQSSEGGASQYAFGMVVNLPRC